MESIIDGYAHVLPEEAYAELKKRDLRSQSLDDGVHRFNGHDKGVAYRFFIHDEYDKVASKKAKYPVYRPIECVEWFVSNKSKPTEQVRFLPEEMLFRDFDDEIIGGKYFEAYQNFKTGLTAPGMPLEKWNVLPDYLVKSLTHVGIFTVEQFAAMPRAKIEGRYPHEVLEAFERAIVYVSGQITGAQGAELSAQVEELRDGLDKKDQQIEELMAMIQGKSEEAPKVKRKRRTPAEMAAARAKENA